MRRIHYENLHVGEVLTPALERNTRNSRRSVFDGDNVCLDLAIHSPPPEPAGDSLHRVVGCFAEPQGVARIGAQRRPSGRKGRKGDAKA